jgi:hypothetical protein
MNTNTISFQIFINIICSFIIIYIIHHIFNHLKNTYSNPVSKDLVNSQLTRYKKIIKELQISSHDQKQTEQDMSNELFEFMQKQ